MIISLAFVTQSYCVVPRDIMLNSNDYFVMKTQKKKKDFDKLHLIIHQILTF